MSKFCKSGDGESSLLGGRSEPGTVGAWRTEGQRKRTSETFFRKQQGEPGDPSPVMDGKGVP